MNNEILKNLSLLRRPLDSHKGDYGHILILAGSRGMTGAAYLTSQAALLSGSGLVTLGIPETLNTIMEIKLTEVMTLPLPATVDGSLSSRAEREILGFASGGGIDVLAVGPGLSRNLQTQTLVRRLLALVDKPIVLDADGLNAIVDEVDILKKTKNLIITPHPGEFSRLTGKEISQVQNNREALAQEFATQYNIIVVLKGYRTVVASPEKVFVNDTGNPGMATGGTGDVLTGMIGAFIGQGLGLYEASCTAVYLHGLAADHTLKTKSILSLTASDILENLPFVLRELEEKNY